MFNQRYRFLVWAMAAIAGIWLVAMGGHWYFENLKMTADKVRAYVESVDFAKLTGAARAKALKDLEDKLNALVLRGTAAAALRALDARLVRANDGGGEGAVH